MADKKESTKRLALVALIVAAACFPLFGIAARLVNLGVPPLFQVTFRVGLGFLLTTAIFQKQIRWSKIKHISKKDWLALLLMGVVGYGISTYLTTVGVLKTTLINTSVVGNVEPFFVFLFAFIFLRDKLDKTNFATFLFTVTSFVGITVVSTNSLVPELSKFGIGELYILGFAATSALYIIGAKLLSDYLNTTEITVITMILASSSTGLIAIVTRESLTFSNLFLVQVAGGLLLGGALNVIAMLLQNFAYKHVQGVLASQILLAATLFSLLYGYLFYRELPTLIELAGSVLVIGSVYLNNMYSR